MVSRHYRVSDCCLTANTHYTTVYHDNPSGVDNFGYSSDSDGRNCFIIPNKQLKYTV
jgi:hypothetical protein